MLHPLLSIYIVKIFSTVLENIIKPLNEVTQTNNTEGIESIDNNSEKYIVNEQQGGSDKIISKEQGEIITENRFSADDNDLDYNFEIHNEEEFDEFVYNDESIYEISDFSHNLLRINERECCYKIYDTILRSVYHKNYIKIYKNGHPYITERLFITLTKDEPLQKIKIKCLRNILQSFYNLLYNEQNDILQQILINPAESFYKVNSLCLMPVLLSTFINRHLNYCKISSQDFRRKQKMFTNDRSLFVAFKQTINKSNYFEQKFDKLIAENEQLFNPMKLKDILFIREILYIFDILEKKLKSNSQLLENYPKIDFLCIDLTKSIYEKITSRKKQFYVSFGHKMNKNVRLSINLIEDVIDINKIANNVDLSRYTQPHNECSYNAIILNFKHLKGMSMVLSDRYMDILLGLFNIYTDITHEEILLKVKKNSSKTSKVTLIETDKDSYNNGLVHYYKKNYRNDSLFKKDLKELIDLQLCRHFSSILSISTYTFEKNNNAKFYGGFYRLTCGHFIGLDLKDNFLDKLNHKCVLCNKTVGIKYYFKALVYLLDGDNKDITFKKRLRTLFH